MRALVIGGNRFFGRHLVSTLLERGAQVMLLNRGHLDDGFGSRVSRIHADRKDPVALERALAGASWDVVYDQACFDALDAGHACRIFEARTGRYVFTSSLSVYPSSPALKEEVFDPTTYVFEPFAYDMDKPVLGKYGEAKRQAEATFLQKARFPVVMVRIPFILGTDDYTGRLAFHIDRVKQGKPIHFPNPEARVSMLHAPDAGRALADLAESKLAGPLNVAPAEPISLKRLMALINQGLGREAMLTSSGDPSPYGVPQDWWMDVSRMRQAGLQVAPIEEWLPTLLK